jgi:hypothetical protein
MSGQMSNDYAARLAGSCVVSAHTPGPWKAHFEEAYYVTGPDLGRVAMMMNLKGPFGMRGRRSSDESAANCRLIAAAPEMLAVLLKLRRGDLHQRVRPLYNEARAAIAKAIGAEL